jgi:hypothetical protein
VTKLSAAVLVGGILLAIAGFGATSVKSESGDATLNAVEKALQAINSERGSISIVGRALTEQEKARLKKLEDAEEWVAKARERLAEPVGGDANGKTKEPDKDGS